MPPFPRLGNRRVSRDQFPARAEPAEGTDGPFDIDTESRSGPTVLRAIALPSSMRAPRGWGARARREWYCARPVEAGALRGKDKERGGPVGGTHREEQHLAGQRQCPVAGFGSHAGPRHSFWCLARCRHEGADAHIVQACPTFVAAACLAPYVGYALPCRSAPRSSRRYGARHAAATNAERVDTLRTSARSCRQRARHRGAKKKGVVPRVAGTTPRGSSPSLGEGRRGQQEWGDARWRLEDLRQAPSSAPKPGGDRSSGQGRREKGVSWGCRPVAREGHRSAGWILPPGRGRAREARIERPQKRTSACEDDSQALVRESATGQRCARRARSNRASGWAMGT